MAKLRLCKKVGVLLKDTWVSNRQFSHWRTTCFETTVIVHKIKSIYSQTPISKVDHHQTSSFWIPKYTIHVKKKTPIKHSSIIIFGEKPRFYLWWLRDDSGRPLCQDFPNIWGGLLIFSRVASWKHGTFLVVGWNDFKLSHWSIIRPRETVPP